MPYIQHSFDDLVINSNSYRKTRTKRNSHITLHVNSKFPLKMSEIKLSWNDYKLLNFKVWKKEALEKKNKNLTHLQVKKIILKKLLSKYHNLSTIVSNIIDEKLDSTSTSSQAISNNIQQFHTQLSKFESLIKDCSALIAFLMKFDVDLKSKAMEIIRSHLYDVEKMLSNMNIALCDFISIHQKLPFPK